MTWFFEVVVATFDASQGGSVAVGFDAPRGREPEPFTVGEPTPSGSHGVCWTSDGFLHIGDEIEECGSTFKWGDVIGVILDEFSGTVTFFKNGHPIAYNGKKLIGCLVGAGPVIPAATVYTLVSIPAPRLEMNVEGNFRNFPTAFPGALAYAKTFPVKALDEQQKV